MANIPSELKYTREHEWAKQEGATVRVGITHYAQEQAGTRVSAHKTFGVVESVKAVSDLFAPVSGEVIEVNAELTKKPELVNQEPYGRGWMLLVKPADAPEYGQLLSADQYKEHLAQSGH